MLKHLFRPLAVLLFVAPLFTLGCASAPPPRPKAPAVRVNHNPAEEALKTKGVPLDRVVAVVNDGVILESELDKQVADISKNVNPNTKLPPENVLRKQVLDHMITVKLELQEAANNGITVSDDDINQAISRIVKRNGLTLDELPEKLKAQGINYADFRKQMRDQITIQKIQEKTLRDQLTITQREVDAQIKEDRDNGNGNTQYHISHILIAVPLNPTPAQLADARKKAEAIYAKLKQGADFASTAIASSDGQQALKGGDLGWRKQSELPTIFTGYISRMNPGDISEPIQSSSGFHIIKLDDVKRPTQKVMVTQTHARHILIKTSVLMTDTQAKARLEELRKQILAGADFAKLAKANSDDAATASNGGDLGWLDPGASNPAFEEQMNKLQVGQISEPFKTQDGWQILQVLGHRNSDQTEESLKNKAYEEIFNRKSEQVLESWVSQLRGEAYLKIYLNSGAAEN